MIDQDLGRRMYTADFCLPVLIGEEQGMNIANELATVLEMTPIEHSHTWTYPVGEYKGGWGFTFVQPITESFIAIDSYLNHPACYVMIRSCKQFNIDRVRALFEDLNYPVTEWRMSNLGL